MRYAIFLNGVFESVLQEILTAQERNDGMICYLQPYKSRPIKLLQDAPPSVQYPIPLYISTTTQLDRICYIADIIGWEHKQDISPARLRELNDHITQYQPGEEEIYLHTKSGAVCVNLLSVINLTRVPNQFSVTNLVKIKKNAPLKARTQAGGWAYVHPLPAWISEEETLLREHLEDELQHGITTSQGISDEARKIRLASAPRTPQQIQVISQAFRRNPDVVVEVLKRANGQCERCQAPAPFLRAKDQSPYLEVHHWKPLSEGGEDTPENAAALCPNCHRELHFGEIREEYMVMK
jgi:5-methylcytosine-specific restriction endonuclease McrA